MNSDYLTEAISKGDWLYLWLYLSEKYGLRVSENFYHYTDINGFIGIIGRCEFWLSHLRYMNDTSEYIEGENICKNSIKKLLPKVCDEQKKFLLELQSLLNKDKSAGLFPFSRTDVFSLSFTRDRDSLDMWRGYGKNSGICIGFDINKCDSLPGIALVLKEQYKKDTENKSLEEIAPKNERFFSAFNVIYDNKLKEALIADVLDIGLKFYKKNVIKEQALQFMTDSLFFAFPFLKNNGFKNEKECRFIDNIPVDSHLNKSSNIQYRERNGIILPYIKYQIVDRSCKPILKWPISEIIVGPCLRQNDLANSIKYFLLKQGYSELANKVVLSDIPYAPFR